MDCLVMPAASLIRRCSTNSRLGYRPLTEEHQEKSFSAVTVLVGKERRVFHVDPFILQESPFRLLMEISVKKEEKKGRHMIFVDVDAILFEHLLWLINNDVSSFFQLNLKEIIDFYAQDV